MPPSQTTADLSAARSAVTFFPAALHPFLPSAFSSHPSVTASTRADIAALLETDPAFSKRERAYLGRKEQLYRGVGIVKRLLQLKREKGWTKDEYLTALSMVDEPIGLNLHEVAFTPVIASQASDEQQAEWLPKCLNHEILGCYLQTELGHGSAVSNLETTSTYDAKADEFILHSPTVSATKWWIGALGVLATHGVVQARLILGGKDYGPHLFLVQLRSLEDHALMPGVEAGDIGPKVNGAMACLDNGWARFTHLHLPRSSLLSRFAQVIPPSSPGAEGTYVQPPHAKLAYGSMVYIRAQMIGNLGWRLAKGATISTRYLHQRRQFTSPSSSALSLEQQVINYPSVYMRLIPQIANSYVFLLAGRAMSSLYSKMSHSLSTGDPSLLPPTHALSSALKVYISTRVVDGLETVRRAMGGHGFLDAMGVGRIYGTELPSVTYEGDNYILNFQVARAALKTLSALASSSSTSSTCSALHPSDPFLPSLSQLTALPSLPLPAPSPSSPSWTDPKYLLTLLHLRAALLTARLAAVLAAGRKQWEDLSWECREVAEAVAEAWVAGEVGKAVEELEGAAKKGGEWEGLKGEKERAVVARLFRFHLLHLVLTAYPSLLALSILPAPSPPPVHSSPPSPASLPSLFDLHSPLETLKAEVDEAARGLLPELVGLTDAFGFTEWELDSAAAAPTGEVYDRLLAKAKADEALNVGTEGERAALRREVQGMLAAARLAGGRAKL
ncbi:hypothetical protein JCM6882_008961 [Rhodosporidiobolus microsporus]